MKYLEQVKSDFESLDHQWRHAPNRDLVELQRYMLLYNHVKATLDEQIERKELSEAASYILSVVPTR